MQTNSSQNAIYFVVERLRSYFQVDSNTALAEILEVAQSTIPTWISRNTIDYKLIIAKCDNINLNWLMLGEGRMLRDGSDDENKSFLEKDVETLLRRVGTLEAKILDLKKKCELQHNEIQRLVQAEFGFKAAEGDVPYNSTPDKPTQNPHNDESATE
ncbi:MAG: helix-turn-helix domain containing protein [Candidatus Cloacimonetes bacterium]|nr:helix-turn-helix domain containing protein [Candidatus Cloacimonadota bacterium]